MGTDHKPWVEIVEQPAPRGHTYQIREYEWYSFRSIRGQNSSKGNNTFPTIKLHGYNGDFTVVVSCVSEDEPYKPHPNDLLGEACNQGVFTKRIRDSDTVSFRKLYIHKAKESIIKRRLDLRKCIAVDPYQTGFQYKIDDIDLTAVRLCFEVSLTDSEGKVTRIVPPVVSQPIYDKIILWVNTTGLSMKMWVLPWSPECKPLLFNAEKTGLHGRIGLHHSPEVHIDKNSPRRLKKHLYEQVEEQLDLCDVTIQVGSWKRKYHWCVLCVSPFFSKLYESDMEERRTGVINLSVGTPLSTQNALDFLYGKEPEVEIHNVSDLIIVADFLMIDDLKDICIKKIKSSKISLKNCLSLLFFSNRFDVLIPKLEDFYLSHIPELLTQDEMLEINRAAVQFIITDETLSYVNRGCILKFLLRWGEFRSERMSEFRELLSLFDMSDISSDLLKQLREKHPDLLSINNFLSEYSPVQDTKSKQYTEKKTYDNVFLLYPPMEEQLMVIFFVFSLSTECWYRIPIRTDVFLSDPEIVIYEKDTILAFDTDTDRLTVCNLASGQCTEKELKFLEEENVLPFQITLTVSRQRIYSVKTFKHTVLNTDARDIANAGPGDLVSFKPTAKVYVSEDLNEEEVAMIPLFSIDEEIDMVCAAEDLLCLLSSKSKRLIVQCLKMSIRTYIDLSSSIIIGENVAMSSLNRNLYIIGAQSGLHIEFEASPKKITWKADKILWTNFSDLLPDCDLVQDKIIRSVGTDTLKWQKLENEEISGCKNEVHCINLPEDISYSTRWHQVVPLQLPKQVTKCHINCPHCRFKELHMFGLSSDEETSGEESDSWSEYKTDSSSFGLHIL